MNYIYKGTNGKNGLVTGNKYLVHWEDGTDGKIWASVFLTSTTVKITAQEYAEINPQIPFMPYVICIYETGEEFRHDWRQAGECRCTHPGKDDGITTCWEHHDCQNGDCTHGE